MELHRRDAQKECSVLQVSKCVRKVSVFMALRCPKKVVMCSAVVSIFRRSMFLSEFECVETQF